MNVSDAALVALDEAIEFEANGRDLYLRAAEAASDPLARAVFEALAEDEKEHVRRVREIYEELKNRPGWPDVTAMVARASGVVDAFERASPAALGAADASAREAFAVGAEMERRGLQFYRDRLAKASCSAEAEFYRRLVAEEEIHLRTLERLRAIAG